MRRLFIISNFGISKYQGQVFLLCVLSTGKREGGIYEKHRLCSICYNLESLLEYKYAVVLREEFLVQLRGRDVTRERGNEVPRRRK